VNSDVRRTRQSAAKRQYDHAALLSSIKSRSYRLVLFAAAALMLAIAGCGGGSDSSSGSDSSETTAEAPTGVVKVAYQPPQGEEDELGKEMLVASQTKDVTASLAKTFELPNPLLVKGVNGIGSGPFYNPEDNSITLPYGFAALVYQLEFESNPEESEYEVGERIGAVNSFILAHEFGHALINNFKLPVLGKEEDAADAISTILLLTVPNGAEYAAASAAFWANFSGRQSPPAIAEYADQHSLDLQRAFDILCWTAGSSETSFIEVAELEVLPESRLEACPSEYEQLAGSIEAELDPHIKHRINLAASAE
jgi:Putative metallopeptidase